MSTVMVDRVRPGRQGPLGRSARRLPVMVLITAVALLVASVVAVGWITRAASPGRSGAGQAGGGMMVGRAAPGMMSGGVWLGGDGVAVTSIAAARARAARAGSASGLRPGEVLRFSDNFYVELKDAAGAAVTEVLVHPATGAVSTELGPAMMWNSGSRAAAVSSGRAASLAAQWLRANRPEETVASVDAYPGYYTVDTADTAGRLVGMLSVNASTGAVWYHTWHGAFVARGDF